MEIQFDIDYKTDMLLPLYLRRCLRNHAMLSPDSDLANELLKPWHQHYMSGKLHRSEGKHKFLKILT